MILKRIINGVVFFSILIALIVLGIRFAPFNPEDNAYNITFEGKDFLLRHTPSPKIVLVGGSNVSIGIDSELLSYKTGYEIINMGVAAPYRYKFFLRLLEDAGLNSSDIVVFLPEYIDYRHDYFYLYRLIVLYPEAMKYFEFPDDYHGDVFFTWISSLGIKYFERADEYNWSDQTSVRGDYIAERNSSSQDILCERDVVFFEDSFQYAVNLVNEFNSDMKKQGVNVLFGFPSFMKDCYVERNKDVIDDFFNFIGENAEFSILGDPEKYVFDKHLFWDTMWHLNYEGKKLRTLRLFEDMMPFLDEDIFDKNNLLHEEMDFQEVLMEIDVPDTVKINGTVHIDVNIVNNGFARINNLNGYYIKVLNSIDSSEIDLEFDKSIQLKNGYSHIVDYSFVAPEKPGIYEIKFEFMQMDDVLGGVIEKTIEVVM